MATMIDKNRNHNGDSFYDTVELKMTTDREWRIIRCETSVWRNTGYRTYDPEAKVWKSVSYCRFQRDTSMQRVELLGDSLKIWYSDGFCGTSWAGKKEK
jgi:hypothetical protein